MVAAEITAELVPMVMVPVNENMILVAYCSSQRLRDFSFIHKVIFISFC